MDKRTKKVDAVYTANAQNEPRSRGPAPTTNSISMSHEKSNTKNSSLRLEAPNE